jgi:hypothetical protein
VLGRYLLGQVLQVGGLGPAVLDEKFPSGPAHPSVVHRRTPIVSCSGIPVRGCGHAVQRTVPPQLTIAHATIAATRGLSR